MGPLHQQTAVALPLLPQSIQRPLVSLPFCRVKVVVVTPTAVLVTVKTVTWTAV
jgi:hypothetical protein